MGGFKELDEQVGLGMQLQSNELGQLILVNVFSIDPADEEALLAAWSHDADFMKEQPGYVSTQLHKGIAGSSTYMNYAVWENLESFRAAFNNPEFQGRIAAYPDSAVSSPHLFKKLAVAGHCLA
ncbi:MAG: antibiotic biosynthesis monooxygenase [Immundisolibacteraceae bacterium]|nr:antibiotic biosynthesis monooxygenase [Immundisolibacteraceae bacterium]